MMTEQDPVVNRDLRNFLSPNMLSLLNLQKIVKTINCKRNLT
jgi:hypothetical protein